MRRDPARVDDRREVEAGEERPGADPALPGEHVLAQRAGAGERRDEAEQEPAERASAATAPRPDGFVPATIRSWPTALPLISRIAPKATQAARSIAPTPLSSAGVADEHEVAQAADRAHARALAEVADDADRPRGRRARRSSPRHPAHRERREHDADRDAAEGDQRRRGRRSRCG